MKLLITDTRGSGRDSGLLVVDPDTGRSDHIGLGYVPEISYDPASEELLVVDTTFPRKLRGRDNRCWLKRYAARDLRLLMTKETPMRPMYTGSPGRSTRVLSSPSGRYIYCLGLEFIQHLPLEDSVYRLKTLRYDRQADALEQGMLAVDSCAIAFGHMGPGDDDLYFHLSCDFPSTVAFGNFSSAKLELLPLIPLPPREHSALETCGSWLNRETLQLSCIDGEGRVYQVKRNPSSSVLLTHLHLKPGQSVGLQQICGGGSSLFIGVSCDVEERALNLFSEIWQISANDGRLEQVLNPPLPLLNFVVSEDGALVAGTNPYRRSVVLLDVDTATCRVELENAGMSPAEVQFLA